MQQPPRTQTITLSLDYLLDWIIISEDLEAEGQKHDTQAFFNSKGTLILLITKYYENN